MKKKFILVLSSGLLLLTACNGSSADSKTIANETYTMMVNTAKKADAFMVNDTLKSSKFNFVYKNVHDMGMIQPKYLKYETYTANLSNVNLSSTLNIGGLSRVDSEGVVIKNSQLVSNLKVNNLDVKGDVDDMKVHGCNPGETPSETHAKISLDSKISDVNAYVNHNVSQNTYYGAYVDFNKTGEELAKVSVTGEDADEVKATVENLANKLKGNYKKSYVSLKSLPIFPTILEGSLEVLLGKAAIYITNFSEEKYDEAAKNDFINQLSQGIEALTLKKVFTFNKAGNVLTYTLNLDASTINELIGKEFIKSGSVAITLKTDDQKRASNIDFKVTGLKTIEIPVVSETIDTTTKIIKSVTINDTDFELSTNFVYSSTYNDIKSGVDTATSTVDWKEIELK